MSNSLSVNNKRIVKNTILLYVRSLIVMIISLYTSRVVLNALGTHDYGLYNVIGGVVSLFAFLRTSLTKSTQRFLNTEMTKQDGRLNETFCTSLNIHVAIAIIALVLAETLGLWFLNNYIQIPEGREFAANVVYQSTVLSLVITIISVPYNAEIIAHEDMGYFAVVSIIDAILKLGIALLLAVGGWDRLIMYAYLMAGVTALNFSMFFLYCRLKYIESIYRWVYDKSMVRSMFNYTSWTIVGQAAIVGTNQGNNILMNMFHSVTANAAMGIAGQVNGAINTLTINFQTAFNPQITKSYAVKNYDNLRKLVFTTSKISYFLLITVSLPVMFNIDLLLNIWLDNVPPNSGVFCVLMLWNTILNALGAPLNFTVLSSGRIKWFQISTAFAFLSDLVVLYPLFILGYPPVTALCVKVASMVLVLCVRIYYTHREIECIDFISYYKEVLQPLALSTIVTVIPAYIIFNCTNCVLHDFLASLVLVVISLVSTLYIGMTNEQRTSILGFCIKRLKKK